MADWEKWKENINAENGFVHHNGITVTEIAEGVCTCQVSLGQKGLNPHDMAHGGLLFTMCDTAAGIAATTTGRKVVSRAADIHFLRPAWPGLLTVRGQVVRAGRQTALCTAEVRDERGELLTTASFEMFFIGALDQG